MRSRITILRQFHDWSARRVSRCGMSLFRARIRNASMLCMVDRHYCDKATIELRQWYETISRRFSQLLRWFRYLDFTQGRVWMRVSLESVDEADQCACGWLGAIGPHVATGSLKPSRVPTALPSPPEGPMTLCMGFREKLDGYIFASPRDGFCRPQVSSLVFLIPLLRWLTLHVTTVMHQQEVLLI